MKEIDIVRGLQYCSIPTVLSLGALMLHGAIQDQSSVGASLVIMSTVLFTYMMYYDVFINEDHLVSTGVGVLGVMLTIFFTLVSVFEILM